MGTDTPPAAPESTLMKRDNCGWLIQEAVGKKLG
jgi:hypothetical protein